MTLLLHFVDSHIGPVIWKTSARRVYDGMIRDVYDGSLYRKHQEFLTAPGNVSFIVNTDGVQLFRSSAYSIWPIWLVMNELPPNERYYYVYYYKEVIETKHIIFV